MLRFFLVATLAACGGASLDVADLGTAELAARCSRFARCGLAVSQESCVAYFRIPPPDRLGAVRDAGRLDYDGGKAQACEDALGEISCDETARDVRVLPDACKQIFHGKVAEGAGCEFDEECQSAHCDLGVCPDGTCCEGTCEADHRDAKVGEACARTQDCVDGYCDADRTCHALAAKAERCTADAQCGYGLACVAPSPSLPGECAALPRIGESCPYQRCADINAICDATFHCVALGLPGAACQGNGDCTSLAECDPTSHVCVEHPRLGMPCTTTCGGESWCKFDDQGQGTCIAPLANGTPCEDSYNCQSQNCRPGPIFDSCQDPACP